MFANAANVGGWNLSNPVAQGASTVYDATKNVLINGADFVKKSTVKITPNASQVAKVLAGGAAGYALSVAVEQLLGAVDWVLDPANNQIKYTDPSGSDGSIDPADQYIYTISQFGKTVKADSASAACSALVTALNTLGSTVYKVDTTQDRTTYFWCNLTANGSPMRSNEGSRSLNPAYDPNAEQEQKTLPLDVVAQQVISNAQSDTDKRAAAQVATTAAAADIVAEAETDDTKARPIANQAEANAETKPADQDAAASANTGSATATPQADPVTGEQAPPTDISLEFPVFCNWAPTVCEAAQVVISFPQTLTGWWESANQRADEWETSISQAYHDFMRDDELPNDDTKVDITEHPVPELKEDAISWVSSCPADEYVPISLQGVTSTLVLSWSPWCQLLSIIKPAIIASAYIGAAFIVLGIRT
ncbi:TPA: hypothetical protein O9Q60_002716 [Staphylococcus aureus]|nr:hypothetical protein [Staphylococcus aureus]